MTHLFLSNSKYSRRIILGIVMSICLAMVTATVGCAAKTIVVHPGAANTFDSVAYDLLLVQKAALKQAEIELKNYPALKPQFDRLVEQYKAAATAYKVYHTVVAGGGAADQTFLDAQIQQLVKDVAALIGQTAGGL